MNARQRAFCREYVKQRNQTRACIAAGYSELSAHVTACRLLKNANVQEEIARLEADLCRRAHVSISSLAEDMRENRDLAIKNDQASAAQQCSMGIAKLHGLLVDKKEVKMTADMSIEEIRERIASVEAELAELEGEEYAAPQSAALH